MKKGALEISFGWIFAIIAGIFIIFIAIYLSTRIINNQQQTTSAETGTQIGILLDPLETSFESAQTTSITLPVDSRIDNICDNTGNFGEQTIQLDQQSLGKWTNTDVNVHFENKYLFSAQQEEGKTFYLFSKPFEFPFKIADLIYITSENNIYCFVNAPDDIATEIHDLNQSNLVVGNCASRMIKICFGEADCDINVNYQAGYVEKKGQVMYFAGTGEDYGTALMYGAIFSDPEVYECQVKRLMMREREIALIYQDKEASSIVQCEKNLHDELTELSYSASVFNSSADLAPIKGLVDIINDENGRRRCMLW